MFMRRLRRLTTVPVVFLIVIIMAMITSCGGSGSSPDGISGETAANNNGITENKTNTTLTVTAIKGGAADTFVLISQDHVAIIDTGLDKKADRLVDFLKEQGVTKVDELIITHFDKDHVGGADHVLDNFEVGKVYVTYHSKDSDDITSYMEALQENNVQETVVKDIVSYEYDGISFTIYPPGKQEYRLKTSNNSSLAIRVVLGEKSMLFTGDAEEERIEELLKIKGLQSTILKVPHHGRYSYNTEDLVKYVKPEYAVITSSKSDPEDREVMDILEENGVVTYLSRDGNITITMTAGEVTITQ